MPVFSKKFSISSENSKKKVVDNTEISRTMENLGGRLFVSQPMLKFKSKHMFSFAT